METCVPATITLTPYPGVASSVLAFVNADTEYFGDTKFVCWVASINCAPIPSFEPDGDKKNQTSLFVSDLVSGCLYQYFTIDKPSTEYVFPFWPLPLKGNDEDGIKLASI